MVILFTLAINACGNDFEEIGNIRVERAEVVKIPIEPPQEIPIDNCDNKGKMSYNIGTEIQRSKNISIGSKASAGAGAKVGILEMITTRLQAEIENAYQANFGSAVTQANSSAIQVAPQTDLIWKVTCEEQNYESLVYFDINRKTYQVPYTYRFCIPVRTETQPGAKYPNRQ
jgi:hypothetical protein